jgi:hypothetical protein
LTYSAVPLPPYALFENIVEHDNTWNVPRHVQRASCALAHSSKAEIWKGLIGSTLVKDKKAAQNAIKSLNLDPDTSKCIGSIDITLFDALALLRDDNCNAGLKQLMPGFKPPFKLDTTLASRYEAVISAISSIVQENSGLSLIETLQQYLYNELSEEMFKDLTKLVHGKLGQCIHDTLIPMIFRHVFDLSSNCCKATKNSIKALTNQTFKASYVQDIMNKILDVFFSKTGNGDSCGYLMVQTVFGQSMEDDLKHFVSLPNNQACAAINGDPFTSLVNGSSSHQFSSSIGCCAAHIDALVTSLSTYPIVNVYMPSEVFSNTPEDCADASSIPAIQLALSQITDESIKAKAESFVSGLCLHLATGFSSSCDFNPSGCSSVSSTTH